MEKSGAALLVFLGLLVIFSQTVIASDPDLTTDFNVTDPTAANFTFTFNLQEQGKGSALPFFASFNMGLPGLSGLGLTAVIFEFGPYSQINPHTHPRATEIFFLIEGTYVLVVALSLTKPKLGAPIALLYALTVSDIA